MDTDLSCISAVLCLICALANLICLLRNNRARKEYLLYTESIRHHHEKWTSENMIQRQKFRCEQAALDTEKARLRKQYGHFKHTKR